MNFAAALPAWNAAATLPHVIAALRELRPAPLEIVVIDDGSTDGTRAAAALAGARVAVLGSNLGRGAARHRAMAETAAPLLLMCDAALEPAADFTTRALRWFDDARVAAVFGHITQNTSHTLADRWRERHLFKPSPGGEPARGALLATGVCMLRRSAIEQAGGFDPRLRSGEDADLGRRLLATGWDVIFDPALRARSLTRDSIHALLGRYARWNSPSGLGAAAFARQLVYAAKVMVRDDLRERDPLAALLSLASPFFQLRRR